MFKRIGRIAKLEARIKELEAINERLREEINDWQESYETVQDAYDEYVDYVEEQKEVMENYLYELKEKLEEAEGADEYINELEEALFKENPNHILVKGMAQYYGERDAIDATFRVSDEILLLNAPEEVNEVSEEVVSEANEVEYHAVINVGIDRVGEVDEIIFLSELIIEVDECEVSEVSAMKARGEERIRIALRKLRGNVSKSEVRGTPPLPPRKRKAC